jgi:group I intron endonuclease
MKNKLNTGVYRILNSVNGKSYVGSTSKVGFQIRWTIHKEELRSGRHRNRHLLAAWRKYGEESFEFLIVERCQPENCLSREQFWMDKDKTYERRCGYNLAKSAWNCLGMKRSAATKARLSELAKGNQRFLGRRHTAASKLKMSLAQKGKTISKETLAKMSAANKGKKLSVETKAKMSAARMGMIFTAERRANISKALMGKKWSPAQRRNIARTKFKTKIRRIGRAFLRERANASDL